MRHLKLILASSLSLTALISAQATIIPWTLSNFEYASEYGQDYVTKVERDNLSFSFSLSDTSGMTSTLPPPRNRSIQSVIHHVWIEQKGKYNELAAPYHHAKR